MIPIAVPVSTPIVGCRTATPIAKPASTPMAMNMPPEVAER